MLKFSGFSDLTSCLGQGPEGTGRGNRHQRDKERTSKMSFKLFVDTATTHALNASRARKHPDAQTRATDETTEVEFVSGMKWSRH